MRAAIVDNNVADFEIIKAICADFPYEVMLSHFVSGKELLQHLKDHPASLDVHFFLIDLRNPFMNGIQLVQTLNKFSETVLIPKIVFSGTQRQEDVVECLSGGANAFIHKSVDPEQYEKTLKHTFDFWGHAQVRNEVIADSH